MNGFHSHRVAGAQIRNIVFDRRAFGMLLAFLLMAVGAAGQSDPPPQESNVGGYSIHQSVDLGGHYASSSGSGEMYDTLVDLQSGPRILGESFDMQAEPNTSHVFFDSLSTTSTGYGGDPTNITTLRMSKGKAYKFEALYRRDRQYYDYNLLDNPLVPSGLSSNGYTFPQVLNSPHLFDTVRRMTDLNLTLFPISKLSFRTGYSHYANQGPSFSSQHNGAQGLFFQDWRNSTDTWMGGLDWKPFSKTTLTYEEHVVHYKGDTNWQLAPVPLQLANGTPVSLGFDNVTLPRCGDGNPPIVTSATSPPTANPTCSGYASYLRSEPTRTILPTEEFRFQSSIIKNVEMTGSVSYTGGRMNLPNYLEVFTGLDNMGKQVFTTTGFANGKRIDVSADYGITWQIIDRVSLSEQFDFADWRQPTTSLQSEVDELGNSMLQPPGAPQPPAITLAPTFTAMKTETSTTTIGWDATSILSLTVGYRYQQRFISWAMPLSTDALPNGTSYIFPIYENAGILGLSFRPTHQLRINAKVEAAYADQSYTQISPRQLQRYHLQVRYLPKQWAKFTGTFHDVEGRDNIPLVNHLDHNRSGSFGVSLMPNPRYALNLNYGYSDVFTQTTICYAATPAPSGPGAGAAPADCGTNTNLGTGYYDAPTHYGSVGVIFSPVRTVHAGAGYSINAINGSAELLNPRMVEGSLQSKYQSPYVDFAVTIHGGWICKASYNHYQYGEEDAVGPTLPRAFQGDVVTLAARYEF